MIDYAKLNIPETQQNRLREFIENEIPKVKFFKPDGKPKKEWKIFYGNTLKRSKERSISNLLYCSRRFEVQR